MSSLRCSLAVVWLAVAGIAHAQPAPSPPTSTPAKPSGDVRSLMASGVKLFEAKDYLGALAVFRDAYARFASAKILLNIGTTLTLLDRKAEAANAYQRYLDSPDADPVKKPEVANAIAQLDRSLGRLAITVTPADAEVQINDEDYQPAAAVARYRVAAGAYRVRARRDKFVPDERAAQIAAGEQAAVELALAAVPEDKPRTIIVPVETGLRGGREVDRPRSRIGAFAMAHLDVPRRGGAALIGVTADVLARLQLHGAAIVGPHYGGYAGASVAIVPGKLRPYVAAGMLIFASDGARYAVRGGGGLELQLNRHLALIAELGVEHLLNPEADIKDTVFIPALGASGRL